MAVTDAAFLMPGADYQTTRVRPASTVAWSTGVGTFDVRYEWDTVATFDSGNLVQVDQTGVTSPDTGAPDSDLSAGLWYCRAIVTDNDDASTDTTATREVTVADASDPEYERFLYLNLNVGVGFAAGLGDGDPDLKPRFLYLNLNVDTAVPVPFIESIAPSIAEAGDAITIRGQGFDNGARDWSAAARLYDDPDPDVGSYVAMTEVDFTAGTDEDVLVVTVPGGASSGWVVVVNDDGT